jgi:hypothetical protein
VAVGNFLAAAGFLYWERMMKIVSTECSEAQQKEDMPELLRLNAQASKTEIMWEFFGGVITLPNGHRYQVMN